MADTRINALSTATSSVSDDYVPIDGTTNGTRKLSAYSPSFGGNATVGGTLTVSGVGSNPFTGSVQVLGTSAPASGSGVEIAGGSPGRIFAYNRTAGSDLPLTINHAGGNVTIASAGAVTTIAGTTASTTTSSGALVVGNGTSGGLGVGGAVNIGSTLTIGGQDLILAQSGVVNWTIRNTTTSGILDIRNGSGSFLTFPVSAGTVEFNATNASTVKVAATTASTSTSSGALVVSGGVGVAGAIYAGGYLSTGNHARIGAQSSVVAFSANNNVDGGLPAAWTGNYGVGVQYLGSSSNAFFIGDGSGGSTHFYTRTGSANTARLSIDNTNGNVTIGGTLQVGNAYVGGAPTATGYIVIKDSTGTSYKIPAVAL